MSEDWKSQGACKDDPDLFFVEGRGNLAATQQAKVICQTKCPVLFECREYVLQENILFGVWGGLSAHQRARVSVRLRQRSMAS